MEKKDMKHNNAGHANCKTSSEVVQSQGRSQETGGRGVQLQSGIWGLPHHGGQVLGPDSPAQQRLGGRGRGIQQQSVSHGIQRQATDAGQKLPGGRGMQLHARSSGPTHQDGTEGGPKPQSQQQRNQGAQQKSGGQGLQSQSTGQKQTPQNLQKQAGRGVKLQLGKMSQTHQGGEGDWGPKSQAQQHQGRGIKQQSEGVSGPKPQTQLDRLESSVLQHIDEQPAPECVDPKSLASGQKPQYLQGGRGIQLQSGSWGPMHQGGKIVRGPCLQTQQQQNGGAAQQSIALQKQGGRGIRLRTECWGPKSQAQQQGAENDLRPKDLQQHSEDTGQKTQDQKEKGSQGVKQQSAAYGQKHQTQQPQTGQGVWENVSAIQQQKKPQHEVQSHQKSREVPQQQQQTSNSSQRVTSGLQQITVEKPFLSISNEQVVPVKDKSCAGIVRGTLGKPGTLEVNYLRLMLDGMPNTAYHYDVTITPDRPKKFMRPAFEQCKREMLGEIEAAFDGNKSCYTNRQLPGPIEHTVEVPDSSNRTKSFKVEIKETKDCEIDMNSLRNYHKDRVFDKPMRAIQALDVILSGNNHERGVRAGRSFFCRPSQPYDLEEGFEAWTGLFQAALLGEEPLINVDIAHKSFPRQSTLLEYLNNMKINPANSLDNYAFKDVQRFLKGIIIQYDPPKCFGSIPKNYKVLDIGETSSKLKFKLDDGKEMTVVAYYQSKGYTLKFPNLNCIKVGSTIRSIQLPMELCSIVGGQALNRKDGEKQVQKMIRFAATSTNKRKEKIMNILQYFQINESAIVRAFGIQVGSHFIKVNSRILPAPFMEYLNGQTVTTNRGAWRMDQKQFLITSKPPNGHKWIILYEENGRGRGINHHELEAFKKDVLKTSHSLSMNLSPDAKIISYGRNQLDPKLNNFLKDGTALVFVVLGNYGTPYAKIKQSAELKVGILTQCIKENTVRRTSRDRTVFSNVLLKVNAKLNGTNHKISRDSDVKLAKLMEPLKRVMYLGADVTHPSPDQRSIPSVVGVTASHDIFGACYNLQYRLQESKQEHIVDMESIVTHHLKVYHKYLNCYPDQIIYYRDGVSDGQFPIITNVELRAIRSACSKLKIEIKLTCIIVVKRHHTRFFPLTQPRDYRDFNNVEPGTVVDQYITHPNEVQFFMVSHQSIQGTAKPTRYNVIVDDSKFDINFLQKLTYNLCHLFPRCNRPVSYPAPAYLAHLVAFRGRVYLEGSQNFSNNLKTEYERRLIKPEFMVRNPMYFV